MRPRELLKRLERIRIDRESASSAGGWEARKAEIIRAMDAVRPDLEAIVGEYELGLMSRAEIARVIAELPDGAIQDAGLKSICTYLTAVSAAGRAGR